MVADDDSLGERLVGRHAQAPPQLGLPDEKQAEPVLGVHLVIGEQAQIFEHLGAQVACRSRLGGMLNHYYREAA